MTIRYLFIPRHLPFFLKGTLLLRINEIREKSVAKTTNFIFPETIIQSVTFLFVSGILQESTKLTSVQPFTTKNYQSITNEKHWAKAIGVFSSFASILVFPIR